MQLAIRDGGADTDVTAALIKNGIRSHPVDAQVITCPFPPDIAFERTVFLEIDIGVVAVAGVHDDAFTFRPGYVQVALGRRGADTDAAHGGDEVGLVFFVERAVVGDLEVLHGVEVDVPVPVLDPYPEDVPLPGGQAAHQIPQVGLDALVQIRRSLCNLHRIVVGPVI